MTEKMTKEEKEVRQYLKTYMLDESLSGYFYLLETILIQLKHPTPRLKGALEETAMLHDMTKDSIRNAIRYCIKDTGITYRNLIIDCINEIRA